MKILFAHLPQCRLHRRHDRRNDNVLDPLARGAVHFKEIHEDYAVLIHRLGAMRRHPPMRCQLGRRRVQLVEPQYRIRVAHIQRQQHRSYSALAARMPPVCTVTIPAPVRTSKNPFSSNPAVTPSQACGPCTSTLRFQIHVDRPATRAGIAATTTGSWSSAVSLWSDFSSQISSSWRLTRTPASRSSEVAGVERPGSKVR